MMDYKDTINAQGVMPASKLAIRLDQAEISFKAGEDKGYAHARQHCEDVIIPQTEKQARKEVVDWIKKNSETFETHSGRIFEFNLRKEEWQTKLKEWGIDD